MTDRHESRQRLVDALNEEHNPSYFGDDSRDAEGLVNAFSQTEVIQTVAATLRVAANWMPEDRERRMLLEAAGNVEVNWGDATCPVCEEVTCDEGCPLSAVRHVVDRGAGL